MKKNFVKPEMKSVRLRDNILAGSSFNGGGALNGGYKVKSKTGDVQNMCPRG